VTIDDHKKQMLEILRGNGGFDNPEKWVDYGISNNFTRVKNEKLKTCPDCSSNHFRFFGQFVYYSSLVRIQECTNCGLIFTDTRIDSEVIRFHFQQAYKDEEYYQQGRLRIFKQISKLADKAANQRANILDVGGAKGHLLEMLSKRRPDLNLTLNDLSDDACQYAKSHYGLRTILGGINDLENVSEKFNVIILSDVIYYEPELRKLWALIPQLTTEKSTVIIRVPNKLPLIRLWQILSKATSNQDERNFRDTIKFSNPEHIYIFTSSYLLTRLKEIGFSQVNVIPSEFLLDGKGDILRQLYYYFSKLIAVISLGKIIITPSLLVVASHRRT